MNQPPSGGVIPDSEAIVKRILSAVFIVVALSSCAGSSVGVGGASGIGFGSGVGIGAGFSFPVASEGSSSVDEAYVKYMQERVYSEVSDKRPFRGKLCTVRITADANGLISSVTRLEGDSAWCDRVIRATQQVNQLPTPPASLVDRLKNGLVVDFIHN